MNNTVMIILVLYGILLAYMMYQVNNLSVFNLREFGFYPKEVQEAVKTTLYETMTVKIRKDFEKTWKNLSPEQKEIAVRDMSSKVANHLKSVAA